MQFNSQDTDTLHVDINSCFATIEQQANPLLRGKPVAVVAYDSPKGCILTASIEAKKMGIKTGMTLSDGRKICSDLKSLLPDPDKYRCVHSKLYNLLSDYSPQVYPKSIDEFVFKISLGNKWEIAQEIKKRIKSEIGDWITVSIGISTNRYLAKIASGLKKPDGLVEINKNNYLDIYSKMELTDLTGIKNGNAHRLRLVGINNVLDFYNSPIWKLKIAFSSISGLYWYYRLHGYEIDDYKSKRKTFGNSVALGKKYCSVDELAPILLNLVQKSTTRMRIAGYKTSGVHLALLFKNGQFWHESRKIKKSLFDFRDIYKFAIDILKKGISGVPVLNISVSLFNLVIDNSFQLELFQDIEKKNRLINSVDSINDKWGDFVVKGALMMKADGLVKDRIGFGRPL